ncbi:carboxylate--amine ligase [Pradoshia sp.]
MPASAVVLDLSPCGIGIIRSLASEGIHVYAYDCLERYKKGRTRFASCKPCPDPLTHDELLLQFLLKERQLFHEDPVLLTGSDEFLQFISKYRTRLAAHYRFLLPDPLLVDSIIDKRLLIRMIQEKNIDSPKTLIVNNPLRYRTILRDMNFPCVVKPVFGYEFRKHLNRKVIVIDDLYQLRKNLIHYSTFGELLIQEIVPGPDEAIYQVGALYDEEKKLKAAFMGRKLDQYPAQYGSGTLVESMVDEEVLQIGLRILEQFNVTGIAAVELKRNCTDGKLKLLGINTRPWLWHSLATRCRINLPYLYYLTLINKPFDPALNQLEGIQWLHFIPHFLSACEKRKFKKMTWLKWIRTLFGPKEFALFKWNDPMPAIRIGLSNLMMDWRTKRTLKKLNQK